MRPDSSKHWTDGSRARHLSCGNVGQMEFKFNGDLNLNTSAVPLAILLCRYEFKITNKTHYSFQCVKHI